MLLTKPFPLSSLSATAWAAVQRLLRPARRTGRHRQVPEFLDTVPSDRSVPLPVAVLSRLLNQEPAMRSRMKHLALIEASYHLSPDDPLRHVPPRTLEIAIGQLEPVLHRHEGLHVLRLQLERRLQTHRARVDAALSTTPRHWRPDAGASSFGALDLGDAGARAFAETMPMVPASTG